MQEWGSLLSDLIQRYTVRMQVGQPLGVRLRTQRGIDSLDTGMMDELGAHEAGITGDKEPTPLRARSDPHSVHQRVSFGMVAAYIVLCAALYRPNVPQALCTAAQSPLCASRWPIVAFAEDYVALGVHDQRAYLSAATSRGASDQVTLFSADTDMLRLHCGSLCLCTALCSAYVSCYPAHRVAVAVLWPTTLLSGGLPPCGSLSMVL